MVAAGAACDEPYSKEDIVSSLSITCMLSSFIDIIPP